MTFLLQAVTISSPKCKCHTNIRITETPIKEEAILVQEEYWNVEEVRQAETAGQGPPVLRAPPFFSPCTKAGHSAHREVGTKKREVTQGGDVRGQQESGATFRTPMRKATQARAVQMTVSTNAFLLQTRWSPETATES